MIFLQLVDVVDYTNLFLDILDQPSMTWNKSHLVVGYYFWI
jgi:hypothetical protein